MPSDMNIKAIDYALTEHPFLGKRFWYTNDKSEFRNTIL